jgi:hypothetical protein
MEVRRVASIKRMTRLAYVLSPLVSPLFPEPMLGTVVLVYTWGASRHHGAVSSNVEWFWYSHPSDVHLVWLALLKVPSNRHADTRIVLEIAEAIYQSLVT